MTAHCINVINDCNMSEICCTQCKVYGKLQTSDWTVTSYNINKVFLVDLWALQWSW